MRTIRATSATRTDWVDQCVVLRGIGWGGYTTLLRLRGERNRPRITYLDGDAHLMSPAFPHEFLKKRLDRFVTEVVVGLDIRCVPAGETTFRRKKKRGGSEADECFYLANAPAIAGRTELHLRHDPPPDLVIEVANTNDPGPAVEAWRRFGVPEVWVVDADSLTILKLQADGTYAETPTSPAFPFLSAAEILGWVNRPQSGNETAWVRDLRDWVRDELTPRLPARPGAGGPA